MREKFLEQMRSMDEYCTYNAEIHHLMAVQNKWLEKTSRAIPAIVTAVSGVLAIQTTETAIWGWVTVGAAVITALSAVFEFDKSYQSHIDTGKGFTVLKHEVRAFLTAFHIGISDEELREITREVLDEYINLVRTAPPTSNRAFKSAQKRIELDGRHETG